MPSPYDAAPELQHTESDGAFDAADDNTANGLINELPTISASGSAETADAELASGPAAQPRQAADLIDTAPVKDGPSRATVKEPARSLRFEREARDATAPEAGDVQTRDSTRAPRLPVFDLGIDSHEPDAGRRTEAWGRVESHRMTASDGTKYNVNFYKPDRQREGVMPVTYTTPWGTDLAGYNDHVGTMFAREGMPTIAVSPEQRDIVKAVRNLGKASLAHDAEVHHLILDKLSESEDEDLEHIVTTGSSRGAMVGFGLQAYAPQHDRQTPYNDYTDPVLAHQLNLRETPWLKVTPQLARELGALAHTAIPSSNRSLRDLVATFPLSPGFWVSQATTGLSLLHGDAGNLADQMPRDSHTHVTLFRGSNFNNARDWKERLAAFPNVTIEERAGVHLSFANIHIIERTVERVNAAQAA